MTNPLSAAQVLRLKSKQQAYELALALDAKWKFLAYPCPDDYCPGLSPVAVCASPRQGYVGQMVMFDGTRSYAVASGASIVDWLWSFGDGTSGTGSRTTHEYSEADMFTVTQRVTDTWGEQDECQEEVEILRGKCAEDRYTRVVAWGDQTGHAYWSPDSAQTVRVLNLSEAGSSITAVACQPLGQVAYYGDSIGRVHVTFDGLVTIEYVTSPWLTVPISSIVVDLVNPDTVWIAIGNRLYRSSDRCHTFTLIYVSDLGAIYALLVNPNSEQFLLIGGYKGTFAWLEESVDNGQTWSNITPAALSGAIRVNSLSYTRGLWGEFWVGSTCETCPGHQEILRGLRTWDGVWTWEAADDGPGDVAAIAARNEKEDSAFAIRGSNSQLWGTTSHPNLWMVIDTLGTLIHTVIGDFACRNILWLGCGNGIYVSYDSGASSSLVYGTSTAVHHMALGELDPGAASISYLLGHPVSGPVTPRWHRITDLLTVAPLGQLLDKTMLPDPTNPQRLYALNGTDFLKSEDRGQTFAVQSSPNLQYLDDVDAAGMIYGRVDLRTLKRSSNQGVTWQDIAGPFPSSSAWSVRCENDYNLVSFPDNGGLQPSPVATYEWFQYISRFDMRNYLIRKTNQIYVREEAYGRTMDLTIDINANSVWVNLLFRHRVTSYEEWSHMAIVIRNVAGNYYGDVYYRGGRLCHVLLPGPHQANGNTTLSFLAT